MRTKKAWIVARKDLSEFRANRQILLTLAAFPIIMSLLPVFILVPLATVIALPPQHEPSMNLSLHFFYNETELRDTTLNNAWVTRSTVIGGYVNSSYVNNGTLLNVVVHGSILDNVTISNAVIMDSVLRNSDYDAASCKLINTVLSGSTSNPDESLKAIFDMFAHSYLLFIFFVMAVAMPTTIASYSFVGEKTNKTLEPLLATPLTDSELLFGKYLAVFVPVYSLILLSFVIFMTVVDIATYPILGYILIPDLNWAIGILVITPLICLVGIALNVLISSKVNDVRTAQQYSAFIIVPVMILFFVGPIGGMTGISVETMLITSVILLMAMLGAVLLSLRVFNREDILTTWK